MRILVLNYEFPPLGGGASAASFYAARELAQRGHRIDVLTCRVMGQPEFETMEGISIYRVAILRKSTHEAGLRAAMSYFLFSRKKLRQLLREKSYDYAHFYFAIPTGLLAFCWQAMTDAPYIVSLRGSDVPNYDANAKLINFLHKLLKPVTRAILRNADSVVANSESLRRLALNNYQDQRIITITNGVCPQDFAPVLLPNRNKYAVTALCVARLIPRKGVNAFLDAIAACKSLGLRVLIAGTGPEKKALIAQAEQLKIAERVEFIGFRTGKELVTYYQQADFLIHPAFTESFSMTLLEAMSCGLPIIASDIGGVPELVEHEINGLLFAPGDVAALVDAIHRMTRSKSLRTRISNANRNKILDRFTWAHIVTQYEKHCFSGAVHAMKEYSNNILQ